MHERLRARAIELLLKDDPGLSRGQGTANSWHASVGEVAIIEAAEELGIEISDTDRELLSEDIYRNWKPSKNGKAS